MTKVVGFKESPAQERRKAPAFELDSFDRKILAALLDNARATNVEIAAKAGLSEAPCSRRIRRLEETGVIEGYSVRLRPEAVGVGLFAIVTLVLDNFSAPTADEFARTMLALPEVLSCYIVSGGYDAVLHVAAADTRAFSDFVLDRLRQFPGVKDVRSSFILRTLKESPGLPRQTIDRRR
jgi:Lrp/AsnC family leucine-responsive transcriptional regulator